MSDRYRSWVNQAESTFGNRDEAMSFAVGGSFDAIGSVELEILKRQGLAPDSSVADIGCGSGRLAKPLANFLNGPYLGTDVVPDLVRYAEKLVSRADWRFAIVEGQVIPSSSNQFDFVCFYSVLTHLLHEESYKYLNEATRVVKHTGRIIFSFLEFNIPSHWSVFEDTVQHIGSDRPLNMFIGRDAIQAWATHLNLEVVEIHDGDKPFHDSACQRVEIPALGQSLCVLKRSGVGT